MTLTHYGEGGGVGSLPNAIEDDWGDNALTARSAVDTGTYQEQLSGGVGDLLKAIYRPEWAAESGTPSATSGELQLSAGDTTKQLVASPSRVEVGAWQVDFQPKTNPAANTSKFHFMVPSVAGGVPSDAYQIVNHYDGQYDLEKVSGGTYTALINSTRTDDTNVDTDKVTRDEDGNFELFLNGTSQGTVTDTTITESAVLKLYNGMDVTVGYDNFTVK